MDNYSQDFESANINLDDIPKSQTLNQSHSSLSTDSEKQSPNVNWEALNKWVRPHSKRRVQSTRRTKSQHQYHPRCYQSQDTHHVNPQFLARNDESIKPSILKKSSGRSVNRSRSFSGHTKVNTRFDSDTTTVINSDVMLDMPNPSQPLEPPPLASRQRMVSFADNVRHGHYHQEQHSNNIPNPQPNITAIENISLQPGSSSEDGEYSNDEYDDDCSEEEDCDEDSYASSGASKRGPLAICLLDGTCELAQWDELPTGRITLYVPGYGIERGESIQQLNIHGMDFVDLVGRIHGLNTSANTSANTSSCTANIDRKERRKKSHLGGRKSLPMPLEEPQMFWLDIGNPTMSELKSLARIFSLHPLTVETIANDPPSTDKYESFKSYDFICYRTIAHSKSSGQSSEGMPANLNARFVPAHNFSTFKGPLDLSAGIPGSNSQHQQRDSNGSNNNNGGGDGNFVVHRSMVYRPSAVERLDEFRHHQGGIHKHTAAQSGRQKAGEFFGSVFKYATDIGKGTKKVLENLGKGILNTFLSSATANGRNNKSTGYQTNDKASSFTSASTGSSFYNSNSNCNSSNNNTEHSSGTTPLFIIILPKGVITCHAHRDLPTLISTLSRLGHSEGNTASIAQKAIPPPPAADPSSTSPAAPLFNNNSNSNSNSNSTTTVNSIAETNPATSIMPSYVVYAILDDLTDELLPISQNTQLEVDAIDELVLVLPGNEKTELLNRISQQRRHVLWMLRMMQGKREVMRAFERRVKKQTLRYIASSVTSSQAGTSISLPMSSNENDPEYHQQQSFKDPSTPNFKFVGDSNSPPLSPFNPYSSSNTARSNIGFTNKPKHCDQPQHQTLISPSPPSSASLEAPTSAAIDIITEKSWSDLSHYITDIHDSLEMIANSAHQCERILARANMTYMSRVNLEMTSETESMNKIMSRLTFLSAVFLPLNLVTGLWGMNIRVPGEDEDTLRNFYLTIGFMVVYGMVLYITMQRVLTSNQ
ncbi:CorA metal ion transporter [Mycoemilia scoparia]|uniref:CorA metal ion transporter n=1 Tax=Mycoemilia scoparia TaxID=417184 RepID=A0A9W8DMJ6_9FUNG|nr:CorA metal ion transporter [Mycoemilia scoparia]